MCLKIVCNINFSPILKISHNIYENIPTFEKKPKI